MASNAVRLLLAPLLLTCALAGAQEVYEWTDLDGNPAYGDTPPPGADARPVQIRQRRGDRGAAQSAPQRPDELQQAIALRERQTANQAAAERAERQDIVRMVEANCASARERLERYTTAQRLFRLLPDGEREYLTDAELDAERAAAMLAVQEWCAG
ncbi:MAG: DUF4124 domain-containing protein [Chromatiales bacterium]|nr:DUF4124 domain-containing protein [Chromatiales bacterium]